MYANEEELNQVVELVQGGTSGREIPSLSARNEAQVLGVVAKEAKRVLAGFETSSAEDRKMLGDKESK